MALMQASVERIASDWDSIAVGPGCGAVKPWTVTFGGRVGAMAFRQPFVMYSVEFGLTKRILIAWVVGGPETVGSDGSFWISIVFLCLG